MLQFLIDFIMDNLFFVLFIASFLCGLALTSKVLQKLFSKILVLGCIYLGLVGLYKLGIGNTVLYEWSLRVIYSLCLFIERTLGAISVSESIIVKILFMIQIYGYNGYNIFVEFSEFAIKYVITYVNDIKDLSMKKDKKVFHKVSSYSLEDYLILKINPNYLTTVLRC